MKIEKIALKDGDLNGFVNYFFTEFPSKFADYLTAEASPRYVSSDVEWSEIEVTINPTLTENDYSSAYCSFDIPGSFASYHFMKHYLKLMNYTIKARYDNIDTIIGWTLLGSLDNKNWIQLDKQTNVDELKKPNALKTFSIHNNNFYFNHYQILLLQNIRREYSFLCFSKIEFFGILSSALEKNGISICKCNHNFCILPFLFCIIFQSYL